MRTRSVTGEGGCERAGAGSCTLFQRWTADQPKCCPRSLLEEDYHARDRFEGYLHPFSKRGRPSGKYWGLCPAAGSEIRTSPKASLLLKRVKSLALVDSTRVPAPRPGRALGSAPPPGLAHAESRRVERCPCGRFGTSPLLPHERGNRPNAVGRSALGPGGKLWRTATSLSARAVGKGLSNVTESVRRTDTVTLVRGHSSGPPDSAPHPRGH